MDFSEDSKISDVIASHPETLGVFLKYGLACVGCSLSPFETVRQGAEAHGFDEKAVKSLIKELKERAKHLTLTETAAERLKKFKKGKKLVLKRINENGKSYFDLEFGDGGDFNVEDKGFTISIEPSIIGEVKGMIIDWIEGKGFVFKH